MKADKIEVTSRTIVAAIVYAVGKGLILYIFFSSVTDDLIVELPEHAGVIRVAMMLAAATAFTVWGLRHLYYVVVHHRDID
jgi:hypothetical protein